MENVYDNLELDSAGYIRPLDSSLSTKAEMKTSIVVGRMKNVYDELEIAELDYAGYIRPLNSSNHSTNEKLTTSIVVDKMENVYDDVEIAELNSTGCAIPLNSSNPISNADQKTFRVKKTSPKCCRVIWIGIIIISVISGIIFLVKYSGLFPYNGSYCSCAEWTGCQQEEILETRACNGNMSTCFWTEWTSWTGCNSSLISGTETRIQIFTGYSNSCQHKEKMETRTCNDSVSSCFWTDWTEWTMCNLPLTIREQTRAQIGKQNRAQIFTGYSKMCDQKERVETRSCYDRTVDIRFDPTTLYSDYFLSKDNTTLSNRYTDRTPYNQTARNQAQKFRGAMVNRCVENSTIIYFEIYFKYLITSNLIGTDLVLEIGIGERNKIGHSSYVADSTTQGWSFALFNHVPSNTVKLRARYIPHHIIEIFQEFSSNKAGTNINGTFGLLIDRERSKFSLFYKDTVLFTFNDVVSNESLCPLFGVHYPAQAEVDLQIVFVGNITNAL